MIMTQSRVTFHLGCDFFCDDDGTLCYAPRKYIKKMMDNYKHIFGHSPKLASSPLTDGDHPELGTMELLNAEDTKIYQSLIGACQWVIQIGRFDITTAVMTMSRFRAVPCQGHMDHIKRIHGYLARYKHGVICIDTDEPNYSNIPKKEYSWSVACYPGAKELFGNTDRQNA